MAKEMSRFLLSNVPWDIIRYSDNQMHVLYWYSIGTWSVFMSIQYEESACVICQAHSPRFEYKPVNNWKCLVGN